jgi:hypothetical protein
VVLEELNYKFALQLVLNPIKEQSSKIASDDPSEPTIMVVFTGASHSSRLIDQFENTHLTVVDLTVASF